AQDHRMMARLYHGQAGQYLDVTARSGIALRDTAICATFADYDNDGSLDLFVIGTGGAHLFRNRGAGKFEDVTQASRIGAADLRGARQATFVDLDHDGDLDLL